MTEGYAIELKLNGKQKACGHCGIRKWLIESEILCRHLNLIICDLICVFIWFIIIFTLSHRIAITR